MFPPDGSRDAQPPETVRTLLAGARLRLRQAGCDAPEMEAELLLAFAMGGQSRGRVLAAQSEVVGPEVRGRFEALLQRRSLREPLAYITGTTQFWKHEFEVRPGVLIPRVDTEVLVESTLAQLRLSSSNRAPGAPHAPKTGVGGVAASGPGPLHILELGTGSGCVITSVLADRPDAVGTGVDLSPVALVVTARNAARLGVAARLELIESHWYDGLAPESRFHAIVCNPPYIPAVDAPELQAEVRDHEPALALFTRDAEGLESYRVVVAGAPQHLLPGGVLLLEAGFGQAAEIVQLCRRAGFAKVDTVKDTQGIQRVVVARLG